MTTPLEKAIAKIGLTALSRAAGVRPPTIHVWLRSTGRVPAERVLAVERATGVSRYELRPDVFGPAPEPTPAVALSRHRRVTDQRRHTTDQPVV